MEVWKIALEQYNRMGLRPKVRWDTTDKGRVGLRLHVSIEQALQALIPKFGRPHDSMPGRLTDHPVGVAFWNLPFGSVTLVVIDDEKCCIQLVDAGVLPMRKRRRGWRNRYAIPPKG